MRTASTVGADTATSIEAPIIAVFCTISKLARLVTQTKPWLASVPRTRHRTDQLVERVVAADVLAQQQRLAVGAAPGGGVRGAGGLLQRLRARATRAARGPRRPR